MRENRTYGRVAAAVLATAATLVAGAGTAHAAPARGPVTVPAGATVVPGRYIVTLTPVAGLTAPPSADALTDRYGGRVTYTYRGSALRGFVLSGSADEAARLAADPRVARVEADTVMRLDDARYYPLWNLDMVDQRSTVLDDIYSFPDSAGTGVHAYVLDTGIRTSHVEFGGRASVGFDAIGDGWNGQDCDADGHGTHVAGTIGGATTGLASRATLVAVRVFDCSAVGVTSQIIAGVDWVTQNAVKPAVANMSLGGGKSATLDAAVSASIASGVTYTISAGNDNSDACNYSPADVPAAITVGASNSVYERGTNWGSAIYGSNYGTCLDLFAPGQNILSANNKTDRATKLMTGTSMAAPHVAGAAALLLALQPQATPAQVAATLTGIATTGLLRADNLNRSPNKLLYVSPTMEAPVEGAQRR
ncbi:S8 family peptidase [Actinoplanes sp. RD1]|uniref:S8 family peptidase n=1 Tax=Actinoplanes sp. RD1 TaxID=3064538 RepID=UPI002741120B|nr:S8 family peptidase [Actinoplanes sp. RD1]